MGLPEENCLMEKEKHQTCKRCLTRPQLLIFKLQSLRPLPWTEIYLNIKCIKHYRVKAFLKHCFHAWRRELEWRKIRYRKHADCAHWSGNNMSSMSSVSSINTTHYNNEQNNVRLIVENFREVCLYFQ